MSRLAFVAIPVALGAVAIVAVGACGSFGAADRTDSGIDLDGGADGRDDHAGDDGGPIVGDGGFVDAGRRCGVDSAFGAPAAPAGVALSPDVRAVRAAGGYLYYAWHTADHGADLAAVELLSDGKTGASQSWFSSINDEETQGSPAPSPDGLTVVYQFAKQSENLGLKMTQRASAVMPFGPVTDVVLTGVVDGVPTEPYVTGRGDLYFSTTNNVVYRMALAGPTATAISRFDEITPASFPVFSDDGLEVFFVRATAGAQKIFHASRSSVSQPFGTSVQLVDLSRGTSSSTRVTWLSPDACTLYVVQNDNALDPPWTFMIAKR